MSMQQAPKALPLSARYAAQAQMGVCGWQLPAHFGNPEAEYTAARESVALLDASFMTVVRASGADHLDYLNRRLSQRVIDWKVGQGGRGNQLNGDGRMEADLEFYRVAEQESLLLAPPAVAGTYLQALMDKFVFSEDARFTDETEAWAAFALIGPKGPTVADAMGDRGRDKVRAVVSNWEGLYAVESEFLLGARTLLVPVAAAEAVAGELHRLVAEAGGSPIGFLAFDTLRVEAGAPWWGIDLNERSIPLEADLTSAIHFNKGCYPGQETIAKITNLGHPARKLVGVLMGGEDPPPAGSRLFAGDAEAGVLTSSTWSPRLGRPVGLAMVKWPHRNAGTVLVVENGPPGEVCVLPFA